MVTRTVRRPGSRRSQGNAGSAGRSASTGPTSAKCSGKALAPVCGVPVRAVPVSASTSAGENRGSVNSSGGRPARCHSPRSRPSIHASTCGSARNGRPSSIAPGANPAHGSPYRWAASAPAGVCWSTSSTSGRYSRTTPSSGVAVNRAYGTMKPSQSERSAARPCPPCARNSRLPVPSTSAPGPTSGRSTGSEPVQATSCPRAASSLAIPTAGLTCPVSGGITSRKRLIPAPAGRPGPAGGRRR